MPGSPFLLTVNPGAAHAPSTHFPEDALPLEGAVGGVANLKSAAGKTFGCSFVLHACDKMGNRCVRGGAHLQVTAKGHSHEALKIATEDLHDGSYSVEIRSETSGSFTLNAQIESVHIIGSPLTMTMLPGLPDVAQTTLQGSGLREATAGERTSREERFRE